MGFVPIDIEYLFRLQAFQRVHQCGFNRLKAYRNKSDKDRNYSR